MTAQPRVTVICATRNAREAVRLTFSSFRRYTPELYTVLVADNGSTDGTLDDLRATPWLTVFSLQERRVQMRAEAEKARAVVSALHARLDAYAATLPTSEQALLTSILAGTSTSFDRTPEWEDDTTLTSHGAALDWLVARVYTPFFLTLDSDVEFLAAGWLTEMLDLMEQKRLVALGEYDRGWGGYRPRLAPHVLLLRTEPFRALCTSFRGFVRIEDPTEAQRWQARSPGFYLDPSELASYRTAVFYSTAAAVFESLVQANACWATIPESTARKFLHLGHMSWAADASEGLHGADTLRNDHRSQLAYVRERLRMYTAPFRKHRRGSR